MLSQALLLYSEREESLLESSLAQHPVLTGIMLVVIDNEIKPCLCAFELKSNSSLDISEEEIDFLLIGRSRI